VCVCVYVCVCVCVGLCEFMSNSHDIFVSVNLIEIMCVKLIEIFVLYVFPIKTKKNSQNKNFCQKSQTRGTAKAKPYLPKVEKLLFWHQLHRIFS